MNTTTAFSSSIKPSTLKDTVVDLRPDINTLGLGLKVQGPSECTAFAFTFLLEYITASQRQLKGLDFSEQYITNVTRKTTGKSTGGLFFGEVISNYLTSGIVGETWYPQGTTTPPDTYLTAIGKATRYYDPKILRTQDAGFGGIDDSFLNGILFLLNQKIPVGVGIRYPKTAAMVDAMYNGEKILDGITDITATTNWFGHSMVIVGYVRSPIPTKNNQMNGYFILRNCGGPDWTDGHGDGHGHEYLSFNFARNHFADFVVVKDVKAQF